MEIADLRAYDRGVRLRHWTVPVNVFMAPTSEDRRDVLNKLMPNTSARRHATLARLHQERAAALEAAYEHALCEAFERNFGRAPRPQDYVVTCVWRDDLPETDKQRLRELGYPASKHRLIARAHSAAAQGARVAQTQDH